MASTPTPPHDAERIRLTITVTPEVHAAFSKLSAASGMSLGRAMGDWLEDTLDAVKYTADLVEKARAAPKMVMREVHAYALGLADETGSLMEKLSAQGRSARGGSERSASPLTSPTAPSPRLVIRGGKSPGKGKGA